MSKKKIIIIGLVITIVGGALLAWIVSISSRSGGPAAGGNTTQSGAATQSFIVQGKPANVPAGDTLAIGTAKGTITVKNFYQTIVASEEEYLIFQRAAAYDFLYNPTDGSFVISINAGPLARTRPQAEATFLAALGIDKTDACKLSVTIGIASQVDSTLAGQALPLSFCTAAGVIQ